MADDRPDWIEANPTVTTERGVVPVPCSWVVAATDGDLVLWRRYPQATSDDGRERGIETETGEALPSPETSAALSIESHEVGSGFESTTVPEHALEIDGEEVFRVRDADEDDVFVTVVEVLRAIDDGESFDDVESMEPDSGETVGNPREERRGEIESRREQNQSLGDFE